jgi:hypothetical protein
MQLKYRVESDLALGVPRARGAVSARDLRDYAPNACDPGEYSSAKEISIASIGELAGTLQGLAGPGVKRKELLAAVNETHPKASRKDIVPAAFYALTNAVGGDVERATVA